MLRKLRALFIYLLFLCISVLLLLEVCYRFYVVDFYKGNLIGLNSEEDLMPTHDRPTVLVLGDSFSADKNSYIKHLRKAIPNHRIINSAVPGTSIRQHRLMAKRRIKRFAPEILIYQIYVGNDLLEYRHATDGKAIGFKRKAYWYLADRFLVLGYLNARMLAFKRIRTKEEELAREPKADATFSAEHYNQRTKLLLKAEPALIQNAALLQGGREEDVKAFCADIKDMLEDLPSAAKVIVVVVPHCAQTGELYLERMVELGASPADYTALLAEDYPFFDYLSTELSSSNCRVINVLPWVKNTGREELYFYPNDPHLNEVGQQRLGDALFQLLEQQSWIPQ